MDRKEREVCMYERIDRLVNSNQTFSVCVCVNNLLFTLCKCSFDSDFSLYHAQPWTAKITYSFAYGRHYYENNTTHLYIDMLF